MSKVLTPSLRFDGFNEPLVSFSLIQLAENDLSNGVFNDAKLVGSGYKLINVKDMYVGDKIELEKLTLLNIGEPEFKRNQVKYGDVFFTRSSIVPSGIAYSNVNLSNDDDLTFDGHLMKMSPDQKLVEPYYLSVKFKTWTLRKRFISRGKQSTMTTIGQSDIADILVEIPSKKEQQKIASFLTSVDSKISHLTEKHRLLTEYKKGVMQQIFSQQLRFKDEDGKAFPEWGNPFLSTVSTLITNGFVGTATPYYTDDSGIPYLYGVNIKNNRINKKSLRYITPEFHKKQLKTNLKIGDLLMVQSGHVGETAIVTEEFVDSNCHALIVTKLMQDKVLPDFINFYFSSEIGKSKLEALKVGSTIIHINTNDLKKFKIPLPSFQEQQKIAELLQSIDKKIAAVAQQVEQTKQFKKGLLQQMFV